MSQRLVGQVGIRPDLQANDGLFIEVGLLSSRFFRENKLKYFRNRKENIAKLGWAEASLDFQLVGLNS